MAAAVTVVLPAELTGLAEPAAEAELSARLEMLAAAALCDPRDATGGFHCCAAAA